MVKPQLIFADLDGTLITAPRGTGPSTGSLVELAVETGGAFFPISARPLADIASLFKMNPLVSVAVGSGGGVLGEVSDGKMDSILREATLRVEEGPALIDWLNSRREEENGIFFLFHDSHLSFAVAVAGGSEGLDDQHLATIVGDRPLRHVTDIAAKQGLLGMSLLIPSSLPQIFPAPPPELLPRTWRATAYPEYRIPGWSWLEILPRNASKLAACKEVLERWIDEFGGQPETVALGDAPEDIGMLRWADRSYCPSTAPQEVQLAVSEVLSEAGGDSFAAAAAAGIEGYLAGRI